ncbi:hypothetical protein [Georgenia sp. SYP-B2076]|uniref:hypothetical protein n=1 Tax=Georgenia sp. SYP-B2076 TaxID=2495881 RepID=UPI000F8DC370|nr:hypothetical protein [Georgenia sp. SYP-B2076]
MRTDEAAGGWRFEVTVPPSDGGTVLQLVHHLTGDADPREVGPGWEYYLDNLAARHGRPLVSFDDYYAAQREYDASLA